jgi:hypothetical protein
VGGGCEDKASVREEYLVGQRHMSLITALGRLRKENRALEVILAA